LWWLLLAGRAHVCVAAEGAPQCWGSGPPTRPFDTPVLQLASGGDVLCALAPDGTVGCTGAPGMSAPPGTYELLAVDGDAGCALDAVGAMRCWGPAVEVAGAAGPFTALAVDDGRACALDPDGQARCWPLAAAP
jgi:hypothetical protein